MKQIHLILLAFCIGIGLSSCEKDDPQPSSQQLKLNPVFTAKIDGKIWEASFVAAHINNDTMRLSANRTSSLGPDVFLIKHYTQGLAKRSYSIIKQNARFDGSIDGKPLSFTSIKGQMNYETVDNEHEYASGTFTLTAVTQNMDTIEVTEGVFKEILMR